MKKIIRHSKFKSNPFGDGGDKRSAQIREILIENQLDYIDEVFALPKNLSVWELPILIVRSVLFVLVNFSWKEIRNPQNLFELVKSVALRLPLIADKYRLEDVLFLWESTVSGNFSYPYLFKSVGKPIIALPHNLESLVPTQNDVLTAKISPDWFPQEIKRLAMCDAVFTIAREECWLLKLFGLNAFYLPYYPPREAESLFLDIREKRKNRTKENSTKQFLLIGSASNPPTFQGMKQIIELFNGMRVGSVLNVGGYNSEILKPFIQNHDNIQLYGTLNNEMLIKFLIEADAVIIHQQATTGALTRIPEMLIAGIPVIINADAARSFYNVNGVVLYESISQLPEVIYSFRLFVPEIYPKPEIYANQFINEINNFSTVN